MAAKRKVAARARAGVGAPAPGAVEREHADEGIAEIMRMMTGGTWVTGASHEAIAEKYGKSPATVKDWATAASRVIRLSVATDPDELRARLLATLETVVSKALTKQGCSMTGELYDAPDLKAAVAAIAEQGKLLGLIVTKHEVNLTEEQARQKYRELTGKDWGT